MRRTNPYRELEKALGYRFRKRPLLEAALTHRSFRFEQNDVTIDNQRLEFLGDAVLGFVAAAHLYERRGASPEGELTALRSRVTSGRALAGVAKALGLGDHIRVGKGEHGSGGRNRPSNLADALEAVVGAAYLDGGLRAVNKIFDRLFVTALAGMGGDALTGNPKGQLQEYTQRRWKQSPRYRVTRRAGPAHDMVFTVSVELPNNMFASGKGRSKQAAEAAAAAAVLKALADAGADTIGADGV